MGERKSAVEAFPNTQGWPVVPPEEHWLKRWHWLRTEDGGSFLASWYWRHGWHWGWSGKPDIEDMEGWTYLAVATPPTTIRAPPPETGDE